MRVLPYLVIVFAVEIIAQESEKNTRLFEDTIIAITECVRRELENGIPEYDVPSFSPLEVADVSMDLSTTGISGVSGYIHASNLFLDGLTGFDQTNVKGSISIIPLRYTASFRLTFPLLNLITAYDVDVRYAPANVNVYGAGQLSFEAVNFAVDLSATASIIGGFRLRNFELWPSLEDLNSFSITGLYHDEEISEIITNIALVEASGLVTQIASTVNDLAYNIVMNAVNSGDAGDSDFLLELQDRCMV